MIRRFAVAVIAAAATITLLPSAPAQAYSACAANTECGWLYYKDAARTQLQGGHTTNCDGVILDWGIKAGYSTFISQKCDDLPPTV